jgi:hypothetical protein
VSARGRWKNVEDEQTRGRTSQTAPVLAPASTTLFSPGAPIAAAFAYNLWQESASATLRCTR